jgi:hypothetical protein
MGRFAGTFWPICAALGVGLLSYALGASGILREQEVAEHELSGAIPPPGLAQPEATDCLEPTDQEQALFRLAVDTLAFSNAQAGPLSIGAHRFLARGLYRTDTSGAKRVCDPADQYRRAGALIASSDHLRRGRLTEYGLELIAKLPDAGAVFAEQVAASAFNTSPQLSELVPQRDIRPMARATLAGLGEYAAPYGARAFMLMGSDDAMGTGAAQIAVAAGHPGALEKVETLMARQLASLPKEQVVPWDARNRLYEMAYALSFGGEQAMHHVRPLQELMSRHVESWAPPFGMVELPPRRMCVVLARIKKIAPKQLEYAYCRDNGPLEQ